MPTDVQLRELKPEDVKFITDSWVKSWRRSRWAGCTPNHLVKAHTVLGIEDLVKTGSTFSVAVTPEYPDRILGWVCHGPPTLDGRAVVHCLYVREDYQLLPIADALSGAAVGEKPGFYTYRTEQTENGLPKWRHAPEIARRKPRDA